MSTDLFRQWRDELATEIEGAEVELAVARQRLDEAETLAAAAAEDRRLMRERVARALLPEEPIAGALAARLHELEPARRAAAGSVTKDRQAIENLEWHIADLRAALSQIDRLLAPPHHPKPGLARERGEAAQTAADLPIVFPLKPAA